MRFRTFPLLLAAASLSLRAADNTPLPFAEAVFTEVVNDVTVVHGDASASKAVKDAKFLAPDLVKTGRKSRAQLTAADGTVARIGSNAVFSFDRDTRTINLQKGAVLFHSPTGKGGGSIVTNSATASVIGTTIIVSATPDGGFKLLVLEGVAKVTFPGGQVATVNAGQMTFVRPGATVENKTGDTPSSSGAPTDSPGEPGAAPAGRPGPVLNFDLAAVNESGLVAGFKSELPSLGKIRLARMDQGGRVADGELQTTGLVILGGGSGDQDFKVIPQNQFDAVISQIVQSAPSPQERLLDVVTKPLDLDGVKPVPEGFVFRTAVQLPASLVPQGAGDPSSLYIQGVVAGNLRFTGTVFDLGFMTGTSHTDLIGFNTLELGSVVFQSAPGTTSLRIAGGRLIITPGATVSARLDATVAPGQATRFDIAGFVATAFDHVAFSNPSGDVDLGALSGDLTLVGGSVATSPTLGTAYLSAKSGYLVATDATIAGGLGAYLFGGNGVSLAGGAVTAAHVEIQSGAGEVAIAGTSVTGTGANSVRLAGETLRLTDTTITSPGPVSAIARTGLASLTHTNVTGSGITITGDSVNLVGATTAPARDANGNPLPNATLDAGIANLDIVAAKDLAVSGHLLGQGATVHLSAARLDVTNAKFKATAGSLDARFGSALIANTELRADAGGINLHTVAGLTLDTGSTLAAQGVGLASDTALITLNGVSIHAAGTPPATQPVAGQPVSPAGIAIAGNGLSLGSGTVLDAGPGFLNLDARTFALDIAKPDITATGANLHAGAITLMGQGGSQDTAGNVTLGGAIRAGSAFLQINAASLATDGYVELSGAGANVTLSGDANLNRTRFTTAGSLNFNLANLTANSVELIGGQNIGISTSGLITIHGSSLTSSGGINLHAVAGLTLDTGSTLAAQGVGLASDTALITLNGVSIHAAGTPPATQPVAGQPVSPAGIAIAGNGLSLGSGTVLDAGPGFLNLDARTFALDIAKPDITATGANLHAGAITLMGQGGSQDTAGNVTLGGAIRAGSALLQINAASLATDGYVELSGAGVDVTLSGLADLKRARLATVTQTGGVGIHAANLLLESAEIQAGADLNIILSGSAGIQSGDLSAGGNALLETPGGIVATNSSGSAGLDFTIRTDASVSWTAGNLTANRLKIGGLAGQSSTAVSLAQTLLTAQEITLAANTVSLNNVSFSGGSSVLLRVQTGLINVPLQGETAPVPFVPQDYKANIQTVTYGGQDIISGPNLIWVPAQNAGDVGAPIHVLDGTTPDFRGAKLDYARARNLTAGSFNFIDGYGSPFTEIPNSHIFRQSSPAMLTVADFGLPAATTLPAIQYGNSSHSPLEVKGMLAANVDLAGPFTLDLYQFSPNAGLNETPDRVDLVATNSFAWSGALTVNAPSYSHRRLEVRARDILARPGSSFVSNLPFDLNAPGPASTLFFGAVNNFLSNGFPATPNTVTHTAGDIEIGAIQGDVTLYQTHVLAGDHLLDTVTIPGYPTEVSFQPGSIRLNTGAPGKQILINGGTLRGRVRGDSTLGVSLSSDLIEIAGASIRSETRTLYPASMNTSDAGTIPGLSGSTPLNPGDEAPSGAISFFGATRVRITGSTLVAEDINLVANNLSSTNTSDPLTDAIEVDGVNFNMPSSHATPDARVSTGIAMSAKTVSISNLVFPDNVQIRLKSQDGNLNIGSKMFGAVNFVNNVGIRSNGSIDTVTPLTTEAGINAKVWVENHSTVAPKIFFNGAPAPVTTTGTPTAADAPIHIQQVGATNTPGLRGQTP